MLLCTRNRRLHKIASNKGEMMRAFPQNNLAENIKDLDIAADSPHMQRSLDTRRILDSMLLKVRQAKLTHEVLITFMAEVSAIVNAHQLIPVSMDPN